MFPCFSIFSLLEVRRRVDVYERFRELFGVIPCILVKSHEQLLDEEVRSYPDPSQVDSALLAFSMLGGEGMDLDRVLDAATGDRFFRSREEYWNDSAQNIVEGIASLVATFPPADGETYQRAEMRQFVQRASLRRILMRQPEFAKHMVKVGREVDVSSFPSVKASTYAVWDKFYADRNRRCTRSDAFDIIIASAIPYVDAVVTENHLAESLRKTKRRDDFIDHLAIYTLRDFRDSAPRG